MKTIQKILWWIPSLVMMYVIFGFSTETGTESSGLSMRVGRAVVSTVDDFFNIDMSEEDISLKAENMQLIIRKGAHMTEYFVLCLMVLIAVTKSIKVYGKSRYLLAGSIVFIYACTDELHQYFVPGRDGRFSDVLIDSAGALIAILIAALISHIYKKHKNIEGKTHE